MSYCTDHVDHFLATYYAAHSLGDGIPQRCNEGVAFDVELVVYDTRPNKKSLFCLRETGGYRRLDCATGPFEVWALYLQLEGLTTPRPLTHGALASVIVALGGRLKCVVVDKFLSRQRIYLAKLHIQHMNQVIQVDVRISDAVTLATICTVPILVSDDVVTRAAEGQL
jgi:bifunctional DNase/RNase